MINVWWLQLYQGPPVWCYCATSIETGVSKLLVPEHCIPYGNHYLDYHYYYYPLEIISYSDLTIWQKSSGQDGSEKIYKWVSTKNKHDLPELSIPTKKTWFHLFSDKKTGLSHWSWSPPKYSQIIYLPLHELEQKPGVRKEQGDRAEDRQHNLSSYLQWASHQS